MAKNVHSRYAPVLPSAAWRLIELLNKLKTGDHVNVPGFYDGIRPTPTNEMHILKSMPSVVQEIEDTYGAKPTCDESNFYDKLNNTPTFNISLINSGATASVVPAIAVANLDIRLVPGQMPDDIFTKVEQYIRELGYDDVDVIKTNSVEPSKTDINTPYLPVVEKATKEIYGNYVIYPIRPSTAPDFLWTNILRSPAIQVRWTDPDSDNHAPNEHLSIHEYLDGIALTIQIIHEVASMK
jgi:acetylornithine deacetylase/succinyl-diaminopimelate desuccinylase-like protein